jgi:hypothetical protein
MAARVALYRSLWGDPVFWRPPDGATRYAELCKGWKSEHQKVSHCLVVHACAALAAVRNLGPAYKGVEMPIKSIMDFGRKEFVSLLKEHDLKVIPMVFSDGFMAPGSHSEYAKKHPKPVWHSTGEDFQVLSLDFIVCVDDLTWRRGERCAVTSKWCRPRSKNVSRFLRFTSPKSLLTPVRGARASPVPISVHELSFGSGSGLDSFSTAESVEYFRSILEYERKTLPPHLQVNHETHRHRILYSPWVVRDLLGALQSASVQPPPTLVADYSHHVNVTETAASDLDGNFTLPLSIVCAPSSLLS